MTHPAMGPVRPVASVLLATLGAALLVVPAALALQSGPSTGSKPAGDDTPAERKTDFGWFAIDPPAGWIARSVPTGMRKALYTLPAPDEKGTPGEFIVFFFGQGQGGSVERNLARWKSQFVQREGVSDEEFTRQSQHEVDGMPVTVVEIRGDYLGMRFPGQPPPETQRDWMMLAAIVETGGGSYYLRTLGPRATLEHWKKAWHAMILGMKAGEGE